MKSTSFTNTYNNLERQPGKAKAALRESEERLRLATQTGKVGIWDWNIVSNKILWTDSLYAIHGVSPNEFNATVEGFATLIYPEDREFVSQAIQAALNDDAPYELEFRAIRPDGKVIWLFTNAQVLRDGGRAVRMLGATLDITERKQTEIALRETEERFARFMQHLPGLAWIKDLEGRYVFANDAAERLWRKSRNELYGKRDEQIFPPDDAAHFRDTDKRALANGLGVETVETTEFEDGLHHSLVRKFPIPGSDGAPSLIGGIAIDITERVRAEEALRDSERMYRAIGESIDYGVWICDAQGRNTYTSESFLRMVGQTQQQCSNFGWGDILHPDDAGRTIAAWQECVRTGEFWDIEHRFRGVDGKWHPILARGVPVKNDHGEILAWAGINLNISRLKQVEDELREADRRKDEFLAILAHELRNPLAPIRTGLQILRLAENNPAAAEQARTLMERQLQQMVRLIDELLDLSRISRGKIELRKERVDLAAILQSAIETSRPLIETAHHVLTVNLPSEPVFVEADLTRLAQVFANLLNNAAKYTDKGGHIQLSATRSETEVIVSIKDNGLGIPVEMLSQVFEMFTQVDRSLEKARGGLGIGLSVAKRLVEMHAGKIEAISNGHGAGSEFIVRLPLFVSYNQKSPDLEKKEHITMANQHRILVADDNEDSATAMAVMLKLLGNEVRTANDGLEALQVAEEFRPELILLDIGMPGKNGYDVCRHIRQQPWGSQVIISALTGWGQDEDKRRSQEAGFDHHLVKPVDPNDLEKLLEELQL
jgi:PAS domain S-box-containing protein